jgi:squalene synthase HpnC
MKKPRSEVWGKYTTMWLKEQGKMAMLAPALTHSTVAFYVHLALYYIKRWIREPTVHRHAVDDAFTYCARVAREHYENFPVASRFLPRESRPYIAAIYAFARLADDMADEGSRSPEERVGELDAWEEKLKKSYMGAADHPVFIALAETASVKRIPQQLFTDLLAAFRMDVTRSRYQTFNDVLGYCSLSANPVGRLVLHVFDDAEESKMALSDHICTALQLANFWQDISLDKKKGRIYVPLEDLEAFRYTEDEFCRGVEDGRFRDLMQFQVERTRNLFQEGKPLIPKVTPHLQFELRLTWNGGMAILKKIEQIRYALFTRRPHLTLADKISILGSALRSP